MRSSTVSRFAVALLLGSTALISSAAALAAGAGFASLDPGLFRELRWRLLGPFRGGRVLAVAGVPGEREHFYFGSVNGGVWETIDAGRTWNPIFDGQPIGSIGAIAIAPSNPKVLYVGTGEADMRSDIAQGNGVYKSSDGGRSFTHRGLADTQQIGRILVDPYDADRALVAALGHPCGPNSERGVFLTSDGGQSWRRVLYKDDATGAIDLAFEPGNPNVVYAALWQTRRPPWSVYPPSNGPGSGLFKSQDGGETWARIGASSLPPGHGRIGLAVAPSHPDRVYAMVDAAKGGGLYRSDDAGATWTLASNDPRIWERGWYFGGIAVEPRDADVVYACNTALYRSRDAGRSFIPLRGDPTGDDYHELWIDAADPTRRILGTDQGASVSLNSGATWSSWFNQPTGQMYHVATDQRFPYWVYGAQQDSGAAGLPSRTGSGDGISLMQFREITPGGESDMIAPDPKDPELVYGGRVDRLDLRTQQTRSVDPTLKFRDVERSTWTLPLVFSRRDPRVLYFGRERLFRTDNDGESWSVISPDLSREDPGVPSTLDAATAADTPRPGSRHGVLYSIAPSRLLDHELWVGTDDGLIWRSGDEGGHWSNVTPAALTPWSKVGGLELSHFDPGTAYAAIDRHRLDDAAPYVYRTHDGGKSWALAVSGIPDGSFVNVVREDPVRPGLLYAGTEKGVYVSFDDGEHWRSFQGNLPVTSVRDIDVHGNDLIIATHGRAFWVLDDVSPLRQIEPAAGLTGVRLFVPATAVRLRPSGFMGTPLPKDEPMAINPPDGALIHYFLEAEARGAVVLSIRDAKGELVRRYASDDAAPEPDLAKIRWAPEWLPRPATLSKAPGLHRFVWPLQYTPAGPTKGGAVAVGVWAPPGQYSVELSADGTVLSQPLTLLPDPRVSLEPEAYARQFALARRIEAVRALVNTAVAAANAMAPTLAAQALLGPAWGERPVGPPPPGLTTLRGLAAQLDKLLIAVDGADAAPSPDAETGFVAIQPAVEASLAAWEKIRR